MKTLIALTALTLAAPPFAQDRLETARANYEACLVKETVALGKGNAEPTSNVFEAAIEACKAGRGSLYVAAMVSRPNEHSGRLSDTYAAIAEDAARQPAMLELMKARRSN